MTIKRATNITWHGSAVTTKDREELLNQKGVVIWFTGLPASGKSTIAHAVEVELFKHNHLAYVLDGDNVRHGLNRNLGFSHEDREENIRRVGELARLFAETGMITMAAFISPYRSDREKSRNLIGSDRFIEVYVKIPLSVAEERDPKGLYKRARAGEIKQFTGIDAPYEEPENPELIIDTSELDLDKCKNLVMDYLRGQGVI